MVGIHGVRDPGREQTRFPWRAKHRQYRKANIRSPALILGDAIAAMTKSITRLYLADPQLKEYLFLLRCDLALLSANVTQHDDPPILEDDIKAEIDRFGEEFTDERGNIDDICDGCGASMDRKELKRCSRCRYARFCNAECLKASWTDSHKMVCEQV
jgi:hypothetical protein